MCLLCSLESAAFLLAGVEFKFTHLMLSMQRLLDVIVSNSVKVPTGLIWRTGGAIVIIDIVCIVHSLIET